MTLFQAALRPVEITSANNTAAYTRSGGGGTNTLTAGIWANAHSMAAAIANANSDSLSLSINVNGYFVASAPSALTLTHSELWRIFGFSGNETPSTSITADYRPLYSWFSTYSHSDMNQFNAPSAGQFFGSKGIDGNLSGIAVEQRDMRSLEWVAELSRFVFPKANVTSYTDSVNGLTRVDEERCFLTMANGARNKAVSNTTSANTSPKGIYYIDDWAEFFAAQPLYNAWGDGDMYFCDTTNTSVYVFCSVSEPAPAPAQFREAHNSHYNPSMTVTSAVAPSWQTSASFA
jgi:hypothetical protein